MTSTRWFVVSMLAVVSTAVMLTAGFIMMVRKAEAELTKTQGNLSVGGCETYQTTELGDERYLLAGGKRLQLMFEPDADGAATDAQLTLYSCVEDDPESCELWYFDSDHDGAPDTAVLTGSSWPASLRVLADIQVPGYLRVYTSVAPADTADIAKWTVCGLGEGL